MRCIKGGRGDSTHGVNRHTSPTRKRRCTKIALVGVFVGLVGALLIWRAGNYRDTFSVGVFLVSSAAMLLVAALIGLRDWKDEDEDVSP